MTPYESAYAHAKACDAAWWDALQKEYGKRAAHVRYTHLGREGKFAQLYAEYQSACKALIAARIDGRIVAQTISRALP